MSLLRRNHFPTVKKLDYSFDIKRILECFDTVTYEQDTINSKANTEFMFGKNEPIQQHYHQWVDRLSK